MSKAHATLTDKRIKNAKPRDKDYKLSDSDGLYLLVTKAGGKHWKLKYYFEDKEKKYSIGKYPYVSLREARSKKEELKTLIADGLDPNEKKKEIKIAKKLKDEKKVNTFKKLALQRLEKVRDDISESHYKRMLRVFENDSFPYIGDKNIDEVTTDDIIEIIQRMEKRGVIETARKLYHAISKTYKWAITNRYAKRNPTSDIDLKELLGKREVKSYATFTDDDNIRGLLLAIDGYQGEYTTKQALKLMSYTALRTINIRYAEWAEIDFKSKQWNIPSQKMKTKNDLIIPLTDSAIQILKDTQEVAGDYKYIFPSIKSKTSPMSDNTLLGAIRRLGFTKEEFTPHGFRAMFSTIAHEKSPFKHEVIEIQLAHSIGNSVSKAYNRAKYLKERIKLMQWWSDYLDELKKQRTELN